MANPFDQQRSLSGIRHVIAVGSGKGGVGKSTVALNLSMALKSLDSKVGLLDADLYGPSIPSMTGTKTEKMKVHQEKLIPIMKYGLKLASIGYLVEEHSAVIWRGPMLFKAIEQFLGEVDWGDLDYLVGGSASRDGGCGFDIGSKNSCFRGHCCLHPSKLGFGGCCESSRYV